MRYLTIILSLIPVLAIGLPIENLFGPVPDLKYALTGKAWFFGLIATLLVTFLSAYLFKILASILPIRLLSSIKIKSTFLSYTLVFITNFLLFFLIADFVFKQRPHLVDSIAYLFQAKIFAAHRLIAPLPPFPEFFYTQNILYQPNGVFAQYPPFHSILLAIGDIWVSANFAQIIIGVLGVLFASLVYRKTFTIKEAFWATTLLALSPFYLFLGVSYMSHGTLFLIFGVCFLFYLRFLENFKLFDLAIFGIFCGLGLATRPLEIIAVGIILFAYMLSQLKRKFNFQHLLTLLLSSVTGLFFYLWYNFHTTGELFLAGYIKLWGSSHQLGFHNSPWGIAYTPEIALRDFLIDWKLINEFLFETPWPALLFLPFVFILKKETKWDRLFLYLAFATPVAYFFYWHRDSFLGPRFMHLSIFFLIPLFVRGFAVILEATKSCSIKFGNKNITGKDFVTASLLVTALYVITFSFPQRAISYAEGLPSFKVDLVNELKQRKEEKALVFISVSFGHRLISLLRGAGVSAPLVEQVYRQSDHCELLEIVNQYYSKNINFLDLINNLNNLLNKKLPIIKLNLTGDPTFRITDGSKISPNCAKELESDLKGFGNYAPFFADNQIDFKGRYVFATDLREHNHRLINLYPGYSRFLYNGKDLLALS